MSSTSFLSIPYNSHIKSVDNRPQQTRPIMRLRQLLVFLLACVLPAVQAAILAIDYGAEFTKLSLVKPGVPFDVLIDRDSSRKISSVVAWKREDRVFGAEGKSSVSW